MVAKRLRSHDLRTISLRFIHHRTISNLRINFVCTSYDAQWQLIHLQKVWQSLHRQLVLLYHRERRSEGLDQPQPDRQLISRKCYLPTKLRQLHQCHPQFMWRTHLRLNCFLPFQETVSPFHRKRYVTLLLFRLHNVNFSSVRRFLNGYVYAHRLKIPQDLGKNVGRIG